MQDSDIQKMLQDGIKKTQLFSNSDLFFNCIVCNQSYNPKNRANLLVCNHFMCQQCFGYQHVKTCKFPGCNKPKQLKKAGYFPLDSQNSVYSNKISEKSYNFTIYIGFNSSVGNIVQNVSENTTVQQLIQQCPTAKYALSNMQGHDQGFLIGRSNYLYSNIKLKKLKQIAEKAGIRENGSNKILIQTRSLGGIL